MSDECPPIALGGWQPPAWAALLRLCTHPTGMVACGSLGCLQWTHSHTHTPGCKHGLRGARPLKVQDSVSLPGTPAEVAVPSHYARAFLINTRGTQRSRGAGPATWGHRATPEPASGGLHVLLPLGWCVCPGIEFHKAGTLVSKSDLLGSHTAAMY